MDWSVGKKRRRSRFRFEEIPEVRGTATSSASRGRSARHDPNRSLASTAGGCDSFLNAIVVASSRSTPPAGDALVAPIEPERREILIDNLHADAMAMQNSSDINDSFVDEAIDSEHEEELCLIQSIPAEGSIEVTSSRDVESYSRNGEGTVHQDAPLKMNNWNVLLGLLVTNGSLKLTKEQYQGMRVICQAFYSLKENDWKTGCGNGTSESSEIQKVTSLPHYTTLYSTYKPVLFKSLTVRGCYFLELVDTRKAGACAKEFSSEGTAQAPVHVVLPSEYARADVATGPVFDLMQSTSLENFSNNGTRTAIPAISTKECVDIWPMVAAREFFYGPATSLSVDKNSWSPSIPLAEVGDTLRVRMTQIKQSNSAFRAAFSLQPEDPCSTVVQGKILSIWTVHHEARKNIAGFHQTLPANLSSRDRELCSNLGFISYKSPSDSVDVEVPEIPQNNESEEVNTSEIFQKTRKRSAAITEAIRLRRSAIKKRRQQIEKAWRDWEKPVLKPGDIVALMEPCVPAHLYSRMLLVQRFWTENEERSRHVLWVPEGVMLEGDISVRREQDTPSLAHIFSPIAIGNNRLYEEVECSEITECHSGLRGPQKYQPVSSTGKLENGELYFIYRFLLYWDGFEVKSGKQATGEGFYMICLNLPVKVRACPSAVRIISQTPPGVKTSAIFNRIKTDIIKGMSDGFSDYNANGERVRIFLDLVGFIGDTPALNAELDVLGHTSNAFCHLCRIVRRSSGLVGSRYTRRDFDGFFSSASRSFYSHSAIRDSGAEKETCRLLGIAPHSPTDDLPLHTLRNAMIQIRSQIPKTVDGLRILSGYLDPYKSCLVAPDHLLTGHFRDCLNVAFQLLPSKQHRVSVEGFILGYLSEAGLPTQNRLLDHKKIALFSMSMSELYALTIVAEFGFVAGCKCLPPLSPRCCTAIHLVGSCNRLIANLWRIPDENYDGVIAVARFNNKSGYSHLRKLQECTTAHIKLVEEVCSIDDNDVLYIESTTANTQRRAQILRDHHACLTAIKLVDKPNVHRLWELAYCTLPMVGHISRVGELALEKAHQGLKRAIKQSNMKDIQLHSMKNAIFTDWQGRLTLLAPGVLRGDSDAILGSLRLLSGRESVYRIRACVTSDIAAQVRVALGPAHCVPALLHSQRKSVLSPRYSAKAGLKWSLKGALENCMKSQPLSTNLRQQAYVKIESTFRKGEDIPEICFSDRILSSLSNGLPGYSFKCGDVFETNCYEPDNPTAHSPFLMQRSQMVLFANPERICGPMICVITTIFEKRDSLGCSEYYATVYPCLKLPGILSNNTTELYCNRYKVSDTMALARIDSFMRPVAVLHECSPDYCRVVANTASITHGARTSPLQGGKFFAKTRAEGYPPRGG